MKQQEGGFFGGLGGVLINTGAVNYGRPPFNQKYSERVHSRVMKRSNFFQKLNEPTNIVV